MFLKAFFTLFIVFFFLKNLTKIFCSNIRTPRCLENKNFLNKYKENKKFATIASNNCCISKGKKNNSNPNNTVVFSFYFFTLISQ